MLTRRKELDWDLHWRKSSSSCTAGRSGSRVKSAKARDLVSRSQGDPLPSNGVELLFSVRATNCRGGGHIWLNPICTLIPRTMKLAWEDGAKRLLINF